MKFNEMKKDKAEKMMETAIEMMKKYPADVDFWNGAAMGKMTAILSITEMNPEYWIFEEEWTKRISSTYLQVLTERRGE